MFMKPIFVLSMVFLFAACGTTNPKSRLSNSAHTAGICTHSSTRFNCVQFVTNYDGDTITVDIPGVHGLLGKNAKIRLRGVDTPEIRTRNTCEKAAGLRAKALVEVTLAQARRVDLTNVSRGKYFRIVADVMADGQSLSKTLISARLAYPYDGGNKPSVDWCKLF